MKRKHEEQQAKNERKVKKQRQASDPSLEFISDPLQAPIIKAAQLFFKKLGSSFRIFIGPKFGWRTVAKLAVRGSGDQGLILPRRSIGLFAPGTHNIVPCYDSKVQHPAINTAAKLCEQVLVDVKATGYSEQTDRGLVRYLLLAVDLTTGKVQLTLVVNLNPDEAETDNKLDEIVKRLGKHEHILHSIWVHSNKGGKHNNAITGRLDNSWVCRAGNPDLAVNLEIETKEIQLPLLHFPPNVFRQANITAFAKIVQAIREFIPDRKTKVLELYGGVGTIGLNLLDLVKRLECSDENPYNVLCFEKSVTEYCLRTGREKIRRKAKYLNNSASERALSGIFRKFNLLIVDPPRKGLDEEVINELVFPTTNKKNRLKRIIYVSCGFKAFQRDCTRLIAGGWVINHVEGHVLFPGSDALETLAVFDRQVLN